MPAVPYQLPAEEKSKAVEGGTRTVRYGTKMGRTDGLPKKYRACSSEHGSGLDSADKAAEWLRGERDKGGQATGVAQSVQRQGQSSADESGDQSSRHRVTAPYP